MPYVKSISVRVTVNKTIAYVLNPAKTENLLLASGINCIPNTNDAVAAFDEVYKTYNDRLYINIKSKKKPIKAHHFVQSFKAEQVTPELAHKIANEWAKRVFGDNRQIVIATHIDKGHIHTHFVVNSLDLNGKKYYANKSTLKKAREISDEICSFYGIESIVGNLHKGVHYKEWDETKKGKSWKHNIKLDIDRAIMKVNSIEELVTVMEAKGYDVKRGKYISIKTKGNDRYVRTKSLGEDYTEENLIKRIKEKDKEIPIIEDYNYHRNTKKQNIKKYSGIQLKYVSLIKLISQLIIAGKKPAYKYNHKRPYSKENDYHINILAMQLRILNKESITSESELINKYTQLEITYNETKSSINKLASLSESLKGVIDNTHIYFNLSKLENLTPADNLKLTIAKSIVQKYNINNEADLNKLLNEYNKTIQKLSELTTSFNIAKTKYMEIKDIVDTYESIKDNNYEQFMQYKNKYQNKNKKIVEDKLK